MGAKTSYSRLITSSRDLAIIRQHFSNDEVIGYLWGKGDLKDIDERTKLADKFLDEMVKLTLKQPSEELKAKLTACCADYPNCHCGQPIEQSPFK